MSTAPSITGRPQSSSLPGRVAAGAEIVVRVFTSLEAAASAWLAVERTAVLTPYQRYDWVGALLRSGLDPVDRMAVAVLYAAGRPVGVLPLAIERQPGFTEARIIGSALSNGDWLALEPAVAATLTPDRLLALLREIAREAGGVDVVRLFNQPARWAGTPNPFLAISSSPAPNNLYYAALPATPLPYVEHRLPNRKRGKIRRGARRLEELFGPLQLRRANDLSEFERQHAAFQRQRGERFAQMGIDNIFATPEFIRFFRELAQTGFHQPRPALVFHALYAGSEIVATTCSAYQGAHYSQYINSNAGGAAGKISLMAVLMSYLMDELIADGITSIDMGAGDFDYKTDWTAPQPLFHSVIALTPRGRLLKPLLGGGSAVKRLIKQTPRLWAMAQATRRVVYRVRHGR